MVISHNIASINSVRMQYNNLTNINKNLERLSSGFRINRSGDDAAGLAISEMMRWQINGLDQASLNAKDGIGLIQTAEGAMSEIHNMLQRGTVLAEDAANGVQNTTSRQAIQKELDMIIQEIDRISENTVFNDVKVLKGTKEIQTSTDSTVSVEGDLPPGCHFDAETEAANHLSSTNIFTDSKGQHYASYLNFSGWNPNNGKGAFNCTCCTCKTHYTINLVDGNKNTTEKSGQHFIYNIGISGANNDPSSPDYILKRIIAGTKNGNPNDHFTVLKIDPNNPNQLVIFDNRNIDIPQIQAYLRAENGKVNVGVATEPKTVVTATPGDIALQLGPESDDMLEIDLPNMSSSKCSVGNVSVMTQDGASRAINSFKKGINFVSLERARLGAYQNRLEHALNRIAVNHENLTYAESRIRDTDMAKEMSSLTKNNIIQQAARSMLAQANQTTDSVIRLLNV